MTAPRPKIIEDSVLAVVLVVFAETMLFAGLISAFQIGKNSVTGGIWPPVGSPMLPVAASAANSVVLLASGLMIFLAWRTFKSAGALAARPRFTAALGLGTFFVLFQGYEWVQLIGQGLTLTSSQLGSYFFLIVGCHALHAVAGLAGMLWVHRGLKSGRTTAGHFGAASIFWGFVVLMWPVLYVQVYL